MDNCSISLKILFFIIDWDKTKLVSGVFKDAQCPIVFMSKGTGTARSEMLDILGLGSTDKALILCMVRGGETPPLIKAVRGRLGSKGAGAGIAFTTPLSALNAPVMRAFLELEKENLEKKGEDPMEKMEKMEKKQEMEEKEKSEKKAFEIKNDLIVSILNHGYSDEFMAKAREAGARGGTIINARGIFEKKAKKFFGISIQDEKEIILILADREKKVPIMQAVSASFGAATKAEGIIFSLPVDQVMSLNEL
jgi:nitrogen regulatory protein PII